MHARRTRLAKAGIRGAAMTDTSEEIDRLRRRPGLGSRRTAGRDFHAGNGCALFDPRCRRKLDAAVRRRAPAHQYSAGFPGGLCRRALGRPSCVALICSRSQLRRKFCATAAWRPARDAAPRSAPIALVFVVAVLVLGEVAAWLALSLRFAAIETTLILLGINLIIADHVWVAGREVIAKSCRARSLTGSAAVARCRARGALTCCACPRRKHPSAALAHISRSLVRR